MRRRIHALSPALIAALLAAASACIEDDGFVHLDDGAAPDEIEPDERDTSGDGVPDLDGLPEDPDMVCGNDTVASARTPTGTRVLFCVMSPGEEIVAEMGTLAQDSYLQQGDEESDAAEPCALELFLRLTDDSTPVPAALVDSCADPGALLSHRAVIDAPVFAARAEEDAALDPVSYANYCGSATAFRDERCYLCYTPGCVASCETWWHTSSDDSCSRFLGRWGNLADQTVASCDGTTLFTGIRRDHFGSYVNFSMAVKPGYWAWGRMSFTGLFNSDFRFISTSLYPGRHRLSKRFIDL